MPLGPKDYNKYEKEMEEFTIEISDDPVSDELTIFFENLSQVNQYIQRVGTIELKALKNEHYYKKIYEDVKTAYENKFNKVMREHKEIQKKSSKDKRKAAASAFLEDEAASLLQASHEYDAAKTFRKMVHKKVEVLKDVGDKISRQITVVKQMIDIGLIDEHSSIIRRNDKGKGKE